MQKILKQVRACTLCAAHLPCTPRPVLQCGPQARILIAGQAPGRKVQISGVPFDDASGERLRDWLGIDAATFYNPSRVAIVPMGFCYPGSGKNGDLPPRDECAPAWRAALLAHMPAIKLTLAIGQYAQAYHLDQRPPSLTAAVRAWRDCGPGLIPLPHPSPRNNIWLRRNPWFAAKLLPDLKKRVAAVLKDS